MLLSPLVDFIPIQNTTGLLLSFLKLAKSFASFSLTIINYTGVIYVLYCTNNGVPVNIQSTLLVIKKFFWLVLFSFFTILFFLAPFFCLVVILSFKQPIQSVDIAHNSYIVAIPLAIFAAMQYFLITEIITSETLIWESLKVAWAIFTKHFVVLALVGIILAVTWYVINITIGAAVILNQNNFDFTVLNKLDFVSPHLSFTENNLYKAVIAIAQTIWLTYTASVFVLAYSRYKDVKKYGRKP